METTRSPNSSEQPTASITHKNEILCGWLDMFTKCSATWGTVSVSAHDGTVRESNGVIVELSAPVTCWIEYSDRPHEAAKMPKLREAIDLVHLALAVAPLAVLPILEQTSTTIQAQAYAEALAGLARGVPYELRVHCEFNRNITHRLKHDLATTFMKRLGTTLSADSAFQSVRQTLVACLESGSEMKQKQIVENPVRLTLNVRSVFDLDMMESSDFFLGLAAFASEAPSSVGRLATPATSSAWNIRTCHAPLVLTKITLSLEHVYVTSLVAAAVTALIDTGVPVECSEVVLDLRYISCVRDELQVFLHQLTRGQTSQTPFTICTVSNASSDDFYVLDGQGQDRSGAIGMLLQAIATAAHGPIKIELGGLLTLCRSPESHQAIFHGLFDLLMSRASPLDSLEIGMSDPVNRSDVAALQHQASEWRRRNPGKMLFVKHLEIDVPYESSAFVDAFLTVLDDAESVSTDAISTQALVAILNYPSLRRLKLSRSVITSMDLFDPSIPDLRVPAKPALTSLELDGVSIEDPSSIHPFVTKLKPPHALSSTLQRFHFSEQISAALTNESALNSVTITALGDALATNRVLSDVMIRFRASSALPVASDAKTRLQRYDGQQIPVSVRSAHVEKARNVAFLSVLHDTASARDSLDASMISQVFGFCAPCVGRQVVVTTTPSYY